jgi:hypothetical protein
MAKDQWFLLTKLEKIYFVHVNAVCIFLSCGFDSGDASYT